MPEEIEFPREMSAEDALFWNCESEPLLRSTTAAITLLAAAPNRELLRARMKQAVVDIPRLRQRVVELPSFVSRPNWVRDPYFDLDYHLRWLRAPETGSLQSVFDLAAAQAMASFDRTRPLWEFTIVEGFERGRAAVIQKLHHAVTDGVGGMLLMDRVYDREPERPPPSALRQRLPEEPEPGMLSLMAEAVRRRARERPARAQERLSRWLGAAREPIGTLRRTISDAIEIGPALVPAREPMSPIATRRSSRYRYRGIAVDLDALKRSGRRQGCSINDAFVTALTGGWRRYHKLLDTPVAELRATVPVNLRSKRGASVSGNQVTMARLALPVDESDPGPRMIETQRRLQRAFARPNELVMNTMAAIGNHIPAMLRGPMMGKFSQGIDFVASCVPGFSVPLYMAGERVEDFYMFGPTAGTALNATLFSYEGRATVALNIDPAAVPDTELFERCIAEGFDEVLKLARTSVQRREPERRPMSLLFPSLEFFRTLQKGLAENPSCTENVPPSEAYCGFSVDDQLFVFEFDGRECAAVVSGGNPIDLDFVLAGSSECWKEVIAHGEARPLAEFIESESIRIESEGDDGSELARAALPLLQSFLDQAQGLDVAGSEDAA
jgi:diacylglycerol O-acyltransferase